MRNIFKLAILSFFTAIYAVTASFSTNPEKDNEKASFSSSSHPKLKKWDEFLYKPDDHNVFVPNYHKIIGTEEAHNKGAFGQGVTIAVIEEGSLLDTDESHCKWVTSILNEIAPQAKLEIFYQPSNLKTDLDYEKWCAESIENAIEKKVSFINISLGWGVERLAARDKATGEPSDEFPQIIAEAIDRAKYKGIGVFIAASNDSSIIHLEVGYQKYSDINKILEKPNTNLRFVIATEYRLEKLDGKNKLREDIYAESNVMCNELWKYGISAPGYKILCDGHNPKKELCSATSFATPMVSASAALVMSLFPELTPIQILNVLDESSRTTKLIPHNSKEEFSKINAVKLLEDFRNYQNEIYRNKNKRGRGGFVQCGRSSSSQNVSDEELKNTEQYEKFVDKAYQDDIVLVNRRQYGRGVVCIPKALKLAGQQVNGLKFRACDTQL